MPEDLETSRVLALLPHHLIPATLAHSSCEARDWGKFVKLSCGLLDGLFSSHFYKN